MTFLNEGTWDRALRIFVAIALLSTGWILGFTTAGVAAFAIGAIALATGVSGWCPAYTLFHLSTAGKR